MVVRLTHAQHFHEDMGNRRGRIDILVPADDIGNIRWQGAIVEVSQDDIGNSLAEGQTHLRSGVLHDVVGRKIGLRPHRKRRTRY